MSRPTIILLPGLLCDARIWASQVEALRPFAEVHVADFSELDSIEAMGRAALDLAGGPVVVIGHSMGARAALEAVRLAPERVVRLGLIDTGIHRKREGEETTRQVLVDLAFEHGMEALAERWLPPMVHVDREADGRVARSPEGDGAARQARSSTSARSGPCSTRPDARPLLADIRCPTLVMVGRQDRWSPLAQHEEIASLIPGAGLVVIEDSGHMSPVEQPGQVNRALLDWLGFPGARATSRPPRAVET